MMSCTQGSKEKKNKKKAPVEIAELKFTETVHDFGTLKKRETISYTFTFENPSDKTLYIGDIDEGCGCLEIQIDKKEILPHSKGKMEVILNTAGERGNIYKVVTIFANVPRKQRNIVVTAHVEY